MRPVIESVAVLGAGNGGKACAADLSLKGKSVRLYESSEFAAVSLDNLVIDRDGSTTLRCSGAIKGDVDIKLVTRSLSEALMGEHGAVDLIFICTVSQAHERLAEELCPIFQRWPTKTLPLVVLNPGGSGGSLIMSRKWREMSLVQPPILVEFSTLTYGCRARGADVTIALKVRRVAFGVLPARESAAVGDCLKNLFPESMIECPTVLAAALCNGNPVIHPAITLLNLGRMEKQREDMFFYKDGVSPMVAKLIEGVDKERMQLLHELGYAKVAMPDPETSVLQGYAESAASYYTCYGCGDTFGQFRAPARREGALEQHRYLQEDVGVGLVLYCALGDALSVPTPLSRGLLHIASTVSCTDLQRRTRDALQQRGLDGLDQQEIQHLLHHGYST